MLKLPRCDKFRGFLSIHCYWPGVGPLKRQTGRPEGDRLGLKRQTERRSVVAGDRFEVRFGRWFEWPAFVPGVLDRWDNPEVTFGVTNDPVFCTCAVHENGCHAAGCRDHRLFPPECALSVSHAHHFGDSSYFTSMAASAKFGEMPGASSSASTCTALARRCAVSHVEGITRIVVNTVKDGDSQRKSPSRN